jgi:hypothetical protein
MNKCALLAAVVVFCSTAPAIGETKGPRTLYLTNVDCVIDGKPGKDVDASYVLHKAKTVSAGCYRPPQATPADLRNPLVGKNVQWGPPGQAMDGTVVEYIGASQEVVVKRCPDGQIFRLGSVDLKPIHTTCTMKK